MPLEHKACRREEKKELLTEKVKCGRGAFQSGKKQEFIARFCRNDD